MVIQTESFREGHSDGVIQRGSFRRSHSDRVYFNIFGLSARIVKREAVAVVCSMESDSIRNKVIIFY